jgi:hypothetical protein
MNYDFGQIAGESAKCTRKLDCDFYWCLQRG